MTALSPPQSSDRLRGYIDDVARTDIHRTAGATSLQAVIAHVDIAAVGAPSFRLVATGTGPILVTDDGAVTAPLAPLLPEAG